MYLNPATHSDEHPASYYLASRAYPDTYPWLESDLSVDVCVVGGGFGGVNTALELAERGYSVALVEGRRIGWGASGRNGGQLIQGIGHGLDKFAKVLGADGVQAVEAMGFEAVRIVRDRIKRYQIDCDLKLGYCDLALKPRQMRDLEALKRWFDAVGYEAKTELVSQHRMHEVVGSDRYVGGLIDWGSGHLHPLNLVTGEARAAARLGVQIFEQSLVTEVVPGEPATVRTEHGSVSADRVVLCGNAYVAGLNPVLAGKVLPAGSYVIATEPLPDKLWQRLLPQDMAVCDQNVALDYYRLSADKRLLFGGLCNYSGRDPKSIEGVLKPHMEKVFPELASVKIDYQWGGMIGIGANRYPQIGRLQANLYYAQAYAGHGLNVTHMAARVIAEHIHGESERLDLFERVKHITFPGGPKFRSPLLAAGMLYHRLKDFV
ncbi:MAG: NAD(P)/FAD-dependent oxidoreductase [Saccharospirillum sp.]